MGRMEVLLLREEALLGFRLVLAKKLLDFFRGLDKFGGLDNIFTGLLERTEAFLLDFLWLGNSLIFLEGAEGTLFLGERLVSSDLLSSCFRCSLLLLFFTNRSSFSSSRECPELYWSSSTSNTGRLIRCLKISLFFLLCLSLLNEEPRIGFRF